MPTVAEFIVRLSQLPIAADVLLTILLTVAEELRAIVAERHGVLPIEWGEEAIGADAADDVVARFAGYVTTLVEAAHHEGRNAVAAAQHFIEAHYTEPLTTATVARAIGHERSYFSTLFHRRTGQTIRRYLTAVRLRHAKARIAEGEKVEAAMLSSGFRSKRSFYGQFRSANGCTPAAFRQHADSRGKSA